MMGHDSKEKLKVKIPLQSLSSFLEQHDCLLTNPEPIVACSITLSNFGGSDGNKDFIGMLMELLNIEDRKSISMSSTFSQLGIDSLGGVELQQMMEREFDVSLTLNELRTMTIAELEAKTLKK